MTKKAILVVGSFALFGVAFAQSKGKKTNSKGLKKDSVSIYKRPILDVFLGGSELAGGDITKQEFDRLAPQGIRLKATNGAVIDGFSFTYAERNLYEDSAANPIIVTDLLTEYCLGDSLSPIISKTIASRTKPGDTAVYDDIHIRMADGKPASGKAMKFVIIRPH
ncbi:MAG: hypothetical protein ABI378_08135 [Chitinophagaceae bacterium]